MEAASVPAADVPRARSKSKGGPSEPRTPWWMWLAVAAIVLFRLFPFYWLINTSLKTGPDLSTSALIPPSPTLDNFESIFNDANFTTALKNSAIVALVTTALALIVGSFCAYALARLRIRFKFAILAVVLTITTFPQITIAATAIHIHHGVRSGFGVLTFVVVRVSARSATAASVAMA